MTLKSGLEVTEGHRKLHNSVGHIRVPMGVYTEYGPIYVCHFRDKARHWSKVTIFSYPCIRPRIKGWIPVGILLLHCVSKNMRLHFRR